jgi:hypothetical protein
VQPVRAHEVTRADAVNQDRRIVLSHIVSASRFDGDSGLDHCRVQRSVQFGAAYPAARSSRELRRGCSPAEPVANPAQWQALRVHSDPGERSDRGRHETFAARLVDRRGSRFEDNGLQAGTGCEQCRHQAGRTSADHDQIYHRAGTG